MDLLNTNVDTTVDTTILTGTVPTTYTATSTLYLPMLLESGAVLDPTDLPTGTVPPPHTALISPLPPAPDITGPSIFPSLPTDQAEVVADESDETELQEADSIVPDTMATPDASPPLVIQPTPDGTVRTNQVPILMYHYLSVPPADADIYRRDLSVSPELFAAHLDAIQAAGYQAITLYDLLANLTQGQPLPEQAVIITFDDGYRDNYTNAFPLLAERDMSATFFVVTDFIDDGLAEYVTWEMVREMYAGGMQIESHGRNHFTLEGRDDDFLIWQALGSAETLEYELGVRPHFVSYPAGEYDENTIDIFESAHYWAGVTTIQGASHSSDNLFELERIRVRNTTSVAELLRLLEVDW